MARLTDEQVVDLRTRYADGATQKELAADFGIAQTAVSAIVTGKTRLGAGGPVAERTPRKRRDPVDAGDLPRGTPSMLAAPAAPGPGAMSDHGGVSEPGGVANHGTVSDHGGVSASSASPRPARPPLTTDDVAAIRHRVESGERRVEVAREFGISRYTVDSIMVGRFRGRPVAEVARERADVRRIRELAAEGVTQVEIATQFGLSQQAVSQIVRRVTHADVE